MTRTYVFIAALFLLLLSGCSSKEYYEPKNVVGDWSDEESSVELIATGSQGAVSEEGTIVDADGVADFKIPTAQRYLGKSDGWIITAKIDGNVTLRSPERNATILMPLEKTVASAAVKGDYLAVLFANDDMGIYRLSTKASYFKTTGTPPVAVDIRITQPYFLGNLVVFPTLDGRFVVVDYEKKEVLRSTVVSSEPYFDNIFYFNVIGNAMVAATQHRLYCLSGQERREKFDLRNVVFDDDGIWVATKEGDVIHLTQSLQRIAKQAFPFAHFLGMIVGKEKIYLLEKEGYLIVMDKAMTQTKVYSVSLGDDDIVFTAKNAFYAGDQVITIE